MSRAAAQSEQSAESEKITPYPFFVELEAGSGAIKAEALKLVMHGMMIELLDGVVNVGEQLGVRFELPADMGNLTSTIQVIKTYDRKVPGKEGPKTQRLAEVHFVKPLRDSQKQKVKSFLKRIKQTGTDLA